MQLYCANFESHRSITVVESIVIKQLSCQGVLNYHVPVLYSLICSDLALQHWHLKLLAIDSILIVLENNPVVCICTLSYI